MGRKGNIGSQVVSCRVPTKLFTKLHNEADDKGIAIGVYIRDILSQENFNQGGQTKIEYREKLVPKIEYRDRVIEKKVPVEYHHEKIIDNPKLIEEIESLTNENKKLKAEIEKLTPKPKPKMTEGFCNECRKKQKLDGEEQCIKCGSDRIQPIKHNQY